jgi:hypothetical protein
MLASERGGKVGIENRRKLVSKELQSDNLDGEVFDAICSAEFMADCHVRAEHRSLLKTGQSDFLIINAFCKKFLVRKFRETLARRFSPEIRPHSLRAPRQKHKNHPVIRGIREISGEVWHPRTSVHFLLFIFLPNLRLQRVETAGCRHRMAPYRTKDQEEDVGKKIWGKKLKNR